MTLFPRRSFSPETPCPEYTKFQQMAEELVANSTETAASADYEQAQKSLLFLYEECQKSFDPLHPRFPGGHRCLKEAYLHFVMLLRNRQLFCKPLPSSPAPQQHSLDAVVKHYEQVTETYVGDRVETDAPDAAT